MPNEAGRLHKDLMKLWEEYQDWCRELMVLEQRLGELRNRSDGLGQELMALYHKSDDGLNGGQNEQQRKEKEHGNTND